jgi:hypothetical protein
MELVWQLHLSLVAFGLHQRMEICLVASMPLYISGS